MTYGSKQLAASFRLVRSNTIKTVEDIPEDKFDYVAAPGLRSVRQLIAHMIVAPNLYLDFNKVKRITTVQGYDFPKALGEAAKYEAVHRSKAELIGLLKSEGEAIASWFDTLDDKFLAETYTDHMGQNPKSRLESLMSIKEHEMHHRGQLALILRLIGQVPPLTRQMQERFAAQQRQA